MLLEKTGLTDDPEFAGQMDRANWPGLNDRLIGVFAGKTRDEWDAIMYGTDICYAPVLDYAEAQAHPHNQGSTNLCHG